MDPAERTGGVPSAAATGIGREANRALLIAYHYPPCGVSSGLQRTLCFSRDLGHHGWFPVVLTAHERAYATLKNDQMEQIPPNVPVRRAFALDATRHLGIRGRYIGWLAIPDSWASWILGAIPSGLAMIRQYRPQVLWSTYPTATAHLIGMVLHRLTGIPWVADFRDPMTEVDAITGQYFPADPRLWRVRRWIERQALQHCARAVFVTPGSLRIHRERYPAFASRMSVIANGFDEENFAAAESSLPVCPGKRDSLFFLHSGTLYPGPDRDPTAFFSAIAKLRGNKKLPNNFRVRLRASGFEGYYKDRIKAHGLDDLVTLDPPTPYLEALAEMMCADGLLVFQGRTSNPAIPAKLYEYLRAHRPIFALVDQEGDTARVLKEARTGIQVPLDNVDEIANGLARFLSQVQQGTASLPDLSEVKKHHSRKSKARELANLLDDLVRETNTAARRPVAIGEREI